jgi:hypothetical protein
MVGGNSSNSSGLVSASAGGAGVGSGAANTLTKLARTASNTPKRQTGGLIATLQRNTRSSTVLQVVSVTLAVKVCQFCHWYRE